MFHCQWNLLLLTPSHPLCSLTLPILPGLCRIAPLSGICNKIVIHSLNSIHDYNMGCCPRTSGVRTRHTPCTLICHPSIFLPGSQNLGNYQSLHSKTNTSHATMNANISSRWLDISRNDVITQKLFLNKGCGLDIASVPSWVTISVTVTICIDI